MNTRNVNPLTANVPKERPILMNASMVKANLEGRKTMTRRVVKVPLLEHCGAHGTESDPSQWDTGYCHYQGGQPGDPMSLNELPCPYGQVGDRFWCRESGWMCENRFFAYSATPGVCKQGDLAPPDNFIYSDYENYGTAGEFRQNGWKRVSSIHMPRWASRLTLEITSMRVERVQDISLEDARAEGIPQTAGEAEGLGLYDMSKEPGAFWDNRTSRENFARLWDSLNEKRGYGWEQNPWCWVISYRKIEKENA